MNIINTARRHSALPRVRKRSSTGSKSTSQAVQGHASLLKNNKNLALTLQQTRCELSAYKNFFEESRDYMNKAKLVKSRMVQLSDALKNFLKALDENILLLDFDESKWPIIKTSNQSNKNFQKGMDPVIEVCQEILEGSSDQGMNCNEENNPEYFNQLVQTPSITLIKTADEEKCNDSKRVTKSPQKKSEGLVENNKGLELYSKVEDVEGNKGISKEALDSQQKQLDPNSLQNLPSSPLPSQAVKTTKIPRCQPLSVNLKKQKFVKESKPPSTASKRKSFDKKYEESDMNFPRRKTFVVKKSNVLTESESIRNITDENEPLLKERLNVPDDSLSSKNDKRKTFVLKSSNILKETEPILRLNKIDKELLTESSDHVNETTDVQGMVTLEKNKRKTFVKKSNDKTVFHQNEDTAEYVQDIVTLEKIKRKIFNKNNDKTVFHQNEDTAEYQISFPIKECAVNLEFVKNCENSDQSENIKSSSKLHPLESLPGFEAAKIKPICAENSKNNELNAEVSSLHMNMISGIPSKQIIENDITSTTNGSVASDKAEVIARNLKSKANKIVPDQIVPEISEKGVDSTNEELICSDKSQKNEKSNEIPKFSPVETCKSFLESSDSEIGLVSHEEFNFSDKCPTFKTTPIRRKVSKSKQKKFFFDGNKRNSGAPDNNSQKNMEIIHSDVNATNINKIDIDKIKKKENIIFVSDENPVCIPSDAGTGKKKTTKTSKKKVKFSEGTSVKNNIEKNSTKLKKVKNHEKYECALEIDDLIPQPKKIKRKNIKKKKKENIYDDTISKFVEVDKVVKLNKVKETETKLESDFPCTKTGKNTFLVRAEIHPPPPPFNMPDINNVDKEDDKLNLQRMQVTVVLNDVLKSKSFEFLNISDRDLLCSRAASVKPSVSGSSRNSMIDPEESIENMRSDPIAKTDDCELHSDAILDIGDLEPQSDPVFETENQRTRRRKQIIYKEPGLKSKVRRN